MGAKEVLWGEIRIGNDLSTAIMNAILKTLIAKKYSFAVGIQT